MTRVLLLTTGGTIASRRGDQGLEPQISARGLLEYMSDLRAHYHIDARDILNLDSSNIQAEEWQTIARAVMENLDAYDGIVITHGTDTMAYTASVLSYMLQNLTKPVVLTGSQMPIDNLLTDARNNLYTAFSAVDCRIPGVSIAFDHKLIRGCRAVKVRTMGFEAFESVNAPYLGEVFANGIHRNESAIRPGDPQHISVNGFVRPWGVFGGGPPSGRPVFGAFPPRWLCVLPYRSLLLQQHTILQKEKDSRENGAELSKQ